MALKLRVISDHYKVLGKAGSRLFGVTGGRIGRAQDNDWILPDPDRYISGHHCKVSFQAGEWLLEDTSTNGVFINGSDMPASVAGVHILQDGDRLRLGDYEIIVSIDTRNDFSPDASGQMPIPPRAQDAATVRPDEDLGEELDLTDLLGSSKVAEASALSSSATHGTHPRGQPSVLATPVTRKPAPAVSGIDTVLDLAKALYPDERPSTSRPAVRTAAPAKSPTRSPRAHLASLLNEDHGDALPRTAAQAGKPDDWQMQTRPYDLSTLSSIRSPSALARPPEAPRPSRNTDAGADPGAGPAAGPAAGLEAFCRGAGIDPDSLPSDSENALLTIAGQMVREVVVGLMDVLKGRADLKSRLRLSQTTIQPGDNNPLKFSASVDEAMMKLLDSHGSRYLGPIEAIRDSFTDLRTHQAALSVAIQAAIDEIMNRIEPADLQDRFDRGLKRGALLGAANKMKYWDLYAEFYHVLNQRNEQGLPTLFAEELARSYEERAAQKKR
ncbi:hypothetical protein ACG33_10540 [Steroidobacter denitrificans]|uniref:FHA domain-containing protein n=1 Tax=Steroidobacter denitrificans TaxID=465721 RepID=A0A127FD44_STEDE|nr:type VI secretion system-associated FHA domain protein TagH [Steroidobacter denitrificans]AMN47528.1 hypothetical protein ACG33_10540 [Steroidobacter denitrificans]